MVMNGRLRVGAFGLAVILAGCRNAAGPEPILSSYRAVYAVLEAESSDVRVVAEDILSIGVRLPLQGALAIVSGAYGSSPLTEAAPGSQPCFVEAVPLMTSGEEGCYVGFLPQAAGALETLTLEMTLPDGSDILGTLVTPAPPVAHFPPDSQRVTVAFNEVIPGDFYPIAVVPVVLEDAPGGERVDVTARVVRAYRLYGGGDTIAAVGCEVASATGAFRDPPLRGQHDFSLHNVVCRENGSVVLWDSLDLAVDVTSMEENYAGYVNQVLGSRSIRASRAGFGLEGAVGVFGAVATTVLPLRIVFVP